LVALEVGGHVCGSFDGDAAANKRGVAAPTQEATDVELSFFRRKLLPAAYVLVVYAEPIRAGRLLADEADALLLFQQLLPIVFGEAVLAERGLGGNLDHLTRQRKEREGDRERQPSLKRVWTRLLSVGGRAGLFDFVELERRVLRKDQQKRALRKERLELHKGIPGGSRRSGL
jgi:hypothetical protein